MIGTSEQRIRRLLETCVAMRLDELSAGVRLPNHALRAELDRMVRDGRIRCLRPVGRDDPDQTFYRLVRATDARYEWEQKRMGRGWFCDEAADREPKWIARSRC